VTELLAELKHLRLMFRETLTAYGARVEGSICQVAESVRGMESSGKGVAGARQAREARDLLALLRELRLKPSKGRRRDLRRIEEAVSNLLTRMDEG
jgi:hypothetical protein